MVWSVFWKCLCRDTILGLYGHPEPNLIRKSRNKIKMAFFVQQGCGFGHLYPPTNRAFLIEPQRRTDAISSKSSTVMT